MNLFARSRWYEAAVAGLFFLAGFYAFYALTESPPTWYDEGLYIQVAESLAERSAQSLQVAPGEYVSSGFITGGYPFLGPIAASLAIFGDTLFSARLPMALFILLFLFSSWRLATHAFGRTEGLLSLALLATLPILYGNGKNVLGEVPGLFYAALSLYFLWRIEREEWRGPVLYAAAGLCAGLAVATKPVYLLFPLAIGLALFLRFRSVSFRFKEISLAVLAFLLPVTLWVFLQFGAGDRAGATLSYYANPYAVSFLETMFGNALRFFTEATPLYCALLFGVWALAVAVRAWKRERMSLAEITAFTLSLLVLVAYLRTAGWYRYFFQALVLSLLFFPHALAVLGRQLGFARPALIVLGLALPLSFFQFWELNFSSFVAEHYRSRTSAEFVRYFGSYPAGKSLFVYDAPEVIPFLSSDNFYQYIKPHPMKTLGDLSLLEGAIPDEVLVPSARAAEAESFLGRYRERERVGPYILYARDSI